MATAADLQRRAGIAWASWERIAETDTSEWSEGERKQKQTELDKLFAQATELDRMAARASGRRIFSPIKRVGV